MYERVKTWSKLTADCEDRTKAPDGPARIFVHADLDDVSCEIHEARVTSYSDGAQPYEDGTRARIDLTSWELEWLIDTLQKAKRELDAETVRQKEGLQV